MLAVWLIGHGVANVIEVAVRRAVLLLRWVTVVGYLTSHTGRLSLAIPRRVGAMSTGDGDGHRSGRNEKFCVKPISQLYDKTCNLQLHLR